MLKIKICPSCGSPTVKKVQETWVGTYKNKEYIVPSLEYYRCSHCGEKLYDREAMRKIEAVSPAFVKRRENKKVPAMPEECD